MADNMRHAAPSILTLDIATQCGFALFAESTVVSGSVNLAPGRHEGPGVRYLRFRREVLNPLRGVRQVFYEEVMRHEGTHAAHVYGGLVAMMMVWCEENAIPYEPIPVGVWKKAVVGKGNCGKPAVIEAMRERGFEPADDNEADALAMLCYVRQYRRSGA